MYIAFFFAGRSLRQNLTNKAATKTNNTKQQQNRHIDIVCQQFATNPNYQTNYI